MNWDPATPGQNVRFIDKPGKRGITTGGVKKAGSVLMVQIDFGPNEIKYVMYEVIEPFDIRGDDLNKQISFGRFGQPIDLRRILVYEKVKGELTNVFYSMEVSNTQYFPHQFRAVLKFIESSRGRLLIADEVGLGKTIEAIYIWKELQARENSQRLLIVCPAMLQQKWKFEFKNRFNIDASIVKADQILDKINKKIISNSSSAFVYIASLESLRPPRNFENESNKSTRAQFARFLEQNTVTDDFALFDLVVVDEAQHLRNSHTRNNRLGHLLNEASRHLVLLTATPIQTSSENLYQLLRLIDPDEFYNIAVFDDMLVANRPIVQAIKYLWLENPNIESAKKEIKSALSNELFKNDMVLKSVIQQLNKIGKNSESRIEVIRQLESRSLLNLYMTRLRKREILVKVAKRAPQVYYVEFTDDEKYVYNQVVDSIRKQSIGKSYIGLFTLILRQRQMASSIVAALTSWKGKEFWEDLKWELDSSVTANQRMEINENNTDDIDKQNILDSPLFVNQSMLDKLEKNDTKFNKLHDFVKNELRLNPKEKFVIFSYFRPTLRYLEKRLNDVYISTALIMGDINIDKQAIVNEFQNDSGISILLSSEVGSEGIDLQFCRIIVNYDLPWNPMKVEQRIGRLDRLGQKADRISIVNFVLKDTIEDQVLYRLYKRIEIFKESIGDLEDILGEITEKLMMDLLDPNLSNEEITNIAKEREDAIINRRAEQKYLENQAVNLIGFSKHILRHVNNSRDKQRWLSASDLIMFVEDFFDRNYSGTKIENHNKFNFAKRIRLSQDAQVSLNEFIENTRPATPTRLNQHVAPITCFFDPKIHENFFQGSELVEPTHPLIQWIRTKYEQENQRLHQFSALTLDKNEAPVGTGDYVFVVQKWSLFGIRSEIILMYSTVDLNNRSTFLSSSLSEQLVVNAAKYGNSLPNAVNLLCSTKIIKSLIGECESKLDELFGDRLEKFRIENSFRCDQQEFSAKKFSGRKISDYENRIELYNIQNKQNLIPRTEGLKNKEEIRLDVNLNRISKFRSSINESEVKTLCAGVVRVQ